MRLAKVEHERCGEWAATTYIMVPDDLTVAQFREAVLAARKKYLDVLEAWHNANPVEWPGISLTLSADKPLPYALTATLGEMLADHAAKLESWKLWEKRKTEALQNFGLFLKNEIPGSEWIWQSDDVLKASTNWGHRHGEKINYGDEGANDLPGPSRLGLSPEDLMEPEDESR